MAARSKPHSNTPHNDLSAEYVRALFTYNRRTGMLRWRKNAPGKFNIYKGKRAGFKATNGYMYVSINKKWYLVHRIAYLYVTEAWPREKTDHKSCKPTDNRWHKIREATASQNGWNRRKQKNNTSGSKGVTWHAQSKKWRAQIVAHGCYHSLGCHKTKQKAHAAYCAAAIKYHGAFARFN